LSLLLFNESELFNIKIRGELSFSVFLGGNEENLSLLGVTVEMTNEIMAKNKILSIFLFTLPIPKIQQKFLKHPKSSRLKIFVHFSLQKIFRRKTFLLIIITFRKKI